MTDNSRCTACGRTFHPDELLVGAQGPICLACDSDAEVKTQMKSGARWTLISGPFLALLGTFCLLIPAFGAYLALLLGLGTLFCATRAIRLARTLSTRDHGFGTGPFVTIGMWISGLVSLFWGGSLLLAAVAGWLALIAILSG